MIHLINFFNFKKVLQKVLINHFICNRCLIKSALNIDFAPLFFLFDNESKCFN
jgi:hypothetical protein